MPCDEALNARMRTALEGHAGITETRMMGGLCFFLNGHMLGGARQDADGIRRFMFRVGKEAEADALTKSKAYRVELGGRKMGGFVYLRDEDCDEATLGRLLAMCLSHAAALPAKEGVA